MFKELFVNELKLTSVEKFKKDYPDAKITFKKKSGDKIVYVNGQTAFNADDHLGVAGNPEQAYNAMVRAYKASKN